jgi:hypothetical protein
MSAFSRLIWADSVTDLAVAVNGGLIEISLPDGWSGRCLPSEIADIGTQFAAAIAEATAMTERWDIVTGCYRDVEVAL